MPGKEMTKDLMYMKMKLANIIDNTKNSQMFGVCQTTNNTSYELVGGGSVDLDRIKFEKLDVVHFRVMSGTVGSSGASCQLWDRINAVEITSISFTGAEDDVVKEEDVKSYFADKTGPMVFECYIKKDGATGPSEICTATVEFHGKRV
jgi:hypothetical protein